MTDPDRALAELTRAETALAAAVDIVDLVDLRNGAAALQAMIRALDAGFELEQRASIFRLRAERKLGGWLQQNISPGNPNWIGGSTVRLGDYGITRSQSSRWQTFADLKQQDFEDYLDECLAKGWDVTAAGLMRHALALTGKTLNPPGVPPRLVLLPAKGQCCLDGFLIRCDGPITGQHIISKQMARGNDAIRDWLRTCPPEIMADCCYAHNVGKYADAPVARRILLLQKVFLFGWAHMEATIDGLPWKVPMQSLTLRGMLDAE